MSYKMRCTIYFIGLFVATVSRAGAELCRTGKWFNSTSPEFNSGSDIESQSPAELSALCPDGGPVAAHCKDEKGETMTGYKNDSANHYIVNCTVSGLQCDPYNNTAGAKCADFAIEYACNCSTTPPPNSISTGVITHPPGSGVSISSTSGAIGNAGTTLNASGGGSSGSGGDSGGSSSVKSSTENTSGGSSAFGGSCTCKNGSNKLSVAVAPMLLSVLFMLF